MNDLGYRRLRTVESRRARVRSGLVYALAIAVSLLFWLCVFGVIFGANTGPAITR